MKEMQAFAKSHPELGEIEGRTKAIFLENLQRGAPTEEAPLVDQTPAKAPAKTPAKTPKFVAAEGELNVSMENTKAEMEAFAKSHPELGEIEGRTKAIFLENLQRAWAQRGSGLGWVVQTPAVQKKAAALTRAAMPVSVENTMKELQKFAATFKNQIGEVEGRTKAVYFANLCTALEQRGLLK